VRASPRAQPRPGVVSALALVAVLALGVTAALLRTGGEAATRPPAIAPLPPASGPHARVFAPLRVSSGHGIATGFALGDGRVVTVAHVVDGPVTVRGRRVRVLRLDRRSDLALLSAPSRSSSGVPGLASARNGEHLRVLRLRDGARSSLSVHVRRSIVAHVSAPGAARAVVRPALELSARVTPGDSGAPVVTDSGALAGVVFASSRNRRDTAYAVDASALAELIDR
jgi:S1-C subfamily serine protease